MKTSENTEHVIEVGAVRPLIGALLFLLALIIGFTWLGFLNRAPFWMHWHSGWRFFPFLLIALLIKDVWIYSCRATFSELGFIITQWLWVTKRYSYSDVERIWRVSRWTLVIRTKDGRILPICSRYREGQQRIALIADLLNNKTRA